MITMVVIAMIVVELNVHVFDGFMLKVYGHIMSARRLFQSVRKLKILSM